MHVSLYVLESHCSYSSYTISFSHSRAPTEWWSSCQYVPAHGTVSISPFFKLSHHTFISIAVSILYRNCYPSLIFSNWANNSLLLNSIPWSVSVSTITVYHLTEHNIILNLPLIHIGIPLHHLLFPILITKKISELSWFSYWNSFPEILSTTLPTPHLSPTMVLFIQEILYRTGFYHLPYPTFVPKSCLFHMKPLSISTLPILTNHTFRTIVFCQFELFANITFHKITNIRCLFNQFLFHWGTPIPHFLSSTFQPHICPLLASFPNWNTYAPLLFPYLPTTLLWADIFFICEILWRTTFDQVTNFKFVQNWGPFDIGIPIQNWFSLPS